MAKQKTIKCPKCDRKFSMAAHLGRHVKSAHTPKAQRNFTDPQSKIMKVSNKGFDQCGNAQAVANEAQIIIAADGRDRTRARAPVGGGFPAPPFRLRGGFTVPP